MTGRTPSTIDLHALVPALYEDPHAPEFLRDLVGILQAEWTLLVAGGTDSSARDLTAVSVDAMADVWDPQRCEARLLPYVAQKVGWDLDTSAPEALQRKVATLAGALLRRKGTPQGIVDALRLLLGLEATYRDAWGQAWTLGPRHYVYETQVGPTAAVKPGDATIRYGWTSPAAGLITVTRRRGMAAPVLTPGVDYTEPASLDRIVLTAAGPAAQGDVYIVTLDGITPYLRPWDDAQLDAYPPRARRLGVDAWAGAAEHADGYARGSLVACEPVALANHDALASAGWGVGFEIERTSASSGNAAQGFLRAVEPGRLANNLSLFLPKPAGPGVTFEFQVDTGFAPTPGRVAIDVSLASTVEDVGDAIEAAVNVAQAGGDLTMTAARRGEWIALVEGSAAAAGNAAITGSAVDLLEAVGMVGGADSGGGFTPVGGGVVVLNLIGATTPAEVAQRLAGALGWHTADVADGLAIQRFGTTLWLRWQAKGAAGDGAITGDAATALAATGMSGGADGVSPRVLTFAVEFPRHLSDDEMRAARAVVRLMKRADTHEALLHPRDPVWSLVDLGGPGGLSLDSATGHLSRARRRRPQGTGLADPQRAALGRSVELLLAATDTRSPRLAVGGRYAVDTDDDCYIRQGGSGVTADPATSRVLRPGQVIEFVVADPRGAYVAVRQVNVAALKYVRLTRFDVDASAPLLP